MRNARNVSWTGRHFVAEIAVGDLQEYDVLDTGCIVVYSQSVSPDMQEVELRHTHVSGLASLSLRNWPKANTVRVITSYE